MSRNIVFAAVVVALLFLVSSVSAEDGVEIAGVIFPKQKVVEGKTLTLNGVALRKAMGFVKVYVAGLYLETPASDANDIIGSEQIKQLYTHYLSSMVTAEKLQDGFIDLMETCNPPEMFQRNKRHLPQFKKVDI